MYNYLLLDIGFVLLAAGYLLTSRTVDWRLIVGWHTILFTTV